MTTCPSELALESYLLAPERSPLAQHVPGCAACQARLAQMRLEGERFQRDVYPATVGAVVEAARSAGAAARQATAPRRAGRWTRVILPLAAAAALMAVLLLRALRGGPPDVALSVYVQAESGPRPVGDGAVIPANATLRFEVEPRAPCCLWLLSVDAAGDIARLYPPKGDSASEKIVHPPRRLDLPTHAVLNGQPGPQRIFAVCTKSPVPWLTVKKAAADKAGKGDEAVRRLRALGDLPAGSTQSTVLVEKRS